MTAKRRKGRSPAQREAAKAARAERAANVKVGLEAFQAEMKQMDPAELARVLAALAALARRYSERNAALILSQDPDATEVHGYWAWRYQGRQVPAYAEGQHGLYIVAPRGDGRTAEEHRTNEAAKQAGENTNEPDQYFGLDLVHDVRFTVLLLCGEEGCGLPIRMTGTEKPKGGRSVHVYAHVDAKPDHKAYPARHDQAPTAVPQEAS